MGRRHAPRPVGSKRKPSIGAPLVAISRALSAEVGAQRFAGKVACVYNPLDYARETHDEYVLRYARPGAALLLGMNPGPWGMAQTGVPFGEVGAVRDWLGISGHVGRPPDEHPKRPVTGFSCHRKEVSGARLWGWARERFEVPEAFFKRFFVWNYCPLGFLKDTGANLTPDKLAASERDALYATCDAALREVVRVLAPPMVIGIGKFAEGRARRALGDALPIATVLHPSPASPIANRGWAAQAERQLAALGVL